MGKEKYKQVFKGELKDLIIYFDSTYKGELFKEAFCNRKILVPKETVYSYDFIYILYRSPDKKYVLYEKYFD